MPSAAMARFSVKWPAGQLATVRIGFGLPALEGLACGAPVIAARAGALPEVVGDAGLLVDPRNPGEIAAALQAVERDAGLAERLAEAGPARAAQFRWSDTAAQVRELLLECA